MKNKGNYNGKALNNTPEIANVAVETKLCEGRATGTQTKLIAIQTITTEAGLHAELVDIAA